MNSSLTRKSLLCNNALNAWVSPCIKSIKNIFLLFLLTLTFSNVFSQTAPILIPTGGFAIDGNLKSNLTVAGVGDWVQGPAGAGGFVLNNDGSSVDATKTFNTADPYNSGSDIIFTEGSKGNSNPNTKWAWSQSSAPDKNDINRALIHLGRDINDNVWMMMAGDRLSTNGTAYIDFELLQNTLTRNTNNNGFTSAGPDSGRTVNDLLITIEYNNGGGVSDVVFYRWQAVGSSFDYIEIPAPGPSGYAVTNAANVDVPFGAFGSTVYNALQFVEAAVNVSQVINVGAEGLCQGLNVKTVVIKTKASSSPSAALKDLVEPLQVTFSIGAVSLAPVGTLCASASPVALVGSPAGGTYSGPGVSGNMFDPSIAGAGVHKIYYEKELRAGCVKKDSIYITVDAASVGGSIAGGTTVCSGTNSGTLTLSGRVGNVIRWEKSTNDGSSWTPITNTTSSLNYNNLTATTIYRAVVQSGSCATANSLPATITVDPATVGGSVTGGKTVCAPTNSGTLTLSGNVGNVIRWEKSTDGGSSWTPIANTTTTLNFSNLAATTIYRAVVQSGVCGTVNSLPATITVDPGTVGGSVTGGKTVCATSNSGTLTLSGNVGNIIRWEKSTDGGSSWTPIANTTTILNFSNLAVTTIYRAVVQSGSCGTANSAPATITVDPATVGGSVTGGKTVCAPTNSGTLTLSGNVGNVIRWEKSTDGGSSWTPIANTTTTLNFSNLAATTIYRAVVQSGSCNTANSGQATITVDPASVGGTVTGGKSVCAPTNSGTLTLSGNVGNVIRWEKSTDNGSSWTPIANTTTTLNFSNLATTTIYRAVVQSGSCGTANSQPATITVTPPAVGGSVTGLGIVCDNNTGGTLTLTGYTGTIVRWESSIDGIVWTPIANTTSSLTYGVLTQRITFRAVVQQGSCGTVNSNPFTVIIISCGPAGNHCTYTQGFYGNVGGLGCSGGNPDGNTMENAQFKMTKAFEFSGLTKVVFGRADINGNSGQDRAFTLFKEDITNGNIFKLLPGGGTATTLGVKAGGTAYGDSYEGATFTAPTTWDAVPLDTKKGTNNGRIRNTLLAQTVALFFNMNNGTNLSGFALHDTLYVRNFDCLSGDAIETAPILQFGLPHNVIEYIASHGGTYTKDMAGLYKLANDVLGGLNVSNSFGNDVANAVDKINNAFDGCRSMVGFYDVPAVIGTNRSAFAALGAVTVTEKKTGTLNVAAYPNPYTDKVNFSITSPVSGIGTMEVYNMIGQKIATVYKGHLFAGIPVRMNYNFLSSNSNNLIYILKVGSYKVSGKLTKL
ncbi:MAG: hypothetical protein V4556_06590 [Bacteroidota bacterium]